MTSLSDKKVRISQANMRHLGYFREQDVRETVLRLKERFCTGGTCAISKGNPPCGYCENIDEIFGEKLI